MRLARTVSTLVCLTNLPLFCAQLWYTKPATQWREALPIGNGRMAAMVFGGVDSEHLQLNEETIYAGKAMDRTNPEARTHVPAVRELLLSGKVVEAEGMADKTLLATPPRQPPYEPLGDLRIEFRPQGAAEVAGYKRSLDLNNGTLTVQYQRGGVHYKREAFASYPDQVIVLHLESDGPAGLDFTAGLDRAQDARASVDPRLGENTVVLSGTALPPSGEKRYADEPRTGVRFVGAVRVLSDGKTRIQGNQIQVSTGKQATLLVCAATDLRSQTPEAECKARLDAAATHSYSDLLGRHQTDFRKLAERTSLTIGNSNEVLETTPTDELLARGEEPATERALVSLYFAYGRYLLQSSSRENSLAGNLQGKWNESLNPAWGSKYTININTEMNYWPAEVCSLPETSEGLLNLLSVMRANGQRTAKEMYGTEGFVAHHNTEVWGDTQPIDGVGSGIWPMGAAWLSLTLWDHYDFGRDVGYLREKAYPLMRDAAVFLRSNLFDDYEGHLVSGPSLSPENRYLTSEGKKASLDVSPTMDVEITRALFAHVVEASTILNVDEELRKQLQEASAKLMPLQVGHFGQLQEWRKDYTEADPGHRHLSHLFAVYPSAEINPSTPTLWKAARASLERRLANGGGGTGWSRAWVVCLWARFQEGDKADESLRVLFSKSTWPNLFDLHPPEIFQIDGNLGATAGIAEMLLQSQNGTLRLLPALPTGWKSGSVTGLRARGGVTVDMTWKEGVVERAVLHAAVQTHVQVKSAQQDTGKELSLGAGETRELTFR